MISRQKPVRHGESQHCWFGSAAITSSLERPLIQWSLLSLLRSLRAGRVLAWELRRAFVTEDIHRVSPGNAAVSYLRCLSVVYQATLCLDSHYFSECFFAKDTQVTTHSDPVKNSQETLERNLVEGTFLRRGAERAKLNQPRSGFWGHKQILNLVGHGGFTNPSV